MINDHENGWICTYTQNIYETVTGTDGNGEAYKTKKITGTTVKTINIPGRPAYTETVAVKEYIKTDCAL